MNDQFREHVYHPEVAGLDSGDYDSLINSMDARLTLEKLYEMSNLDDKTIRIIKLRFFDGLLYKEIAHRYKVSEQSIKQRVEKAFVKIQNTNRTEL